MLTAGMRSIQVKLFRSWSVGPAPVEMRASPELADQWVAERQDARPCECALLPAVLTPRTIRRFSAQGYSTRWAAAAAAVS